MSSIVWKPNWWYICSELWAEMGWFGLEDTRSHYIGMQVLYSNIQFHLIQLGQQRATMRSFWFQTMQRSGTNWTANLSSDLSDLVKKIPHHLSMFLFLNLAWFWWKSCFTSTRLRTKANIYLMIISFVFPSYFLACCKFDHFEALAFLVCLWWLWYFWVCLCRAVQALPKLWNPAFWCVPVFW